MQILCQNGSVKYNEPDAGLMLAQRLQYQPSINPT